MIGHRADSGDLSARNLWCLLRLRRPTLYPAELSVLVESVGYLGGRANARRIVRGPLSYLVRKLRTLVNGCAPAIAAALLASSPAHADPALTLARVAVAEAGFRAPTDHAAIFHVLQRRAHRAGWSIERMSYAYSSPMKRGMPAWARRAPASAWAPVIARARAFLRGEVPNPCPGADHWGDRRGDLLRARRAGWRMAGCTGTLNAFWRM